MPELSTLLPLVAFLLGVGAFAGVLAGLLGVGGGIVLVPAFYYVFQVLGYDGPNVMQICVATSLATIVVTSWRSVKAHAGRGAVAFDILRGWGPGIVAGAAVGAGTATLLRSDTLTAIFAVLALVVSVYMAVSRPGWRLAPEMPKGWRRYLYSPVVGFLSVLMGIGGGSFGVPLMTLHGVVIHRAVATAAGFGMLIAVPAVLLFLVLPAQGVRPPMTVGLVNLPAFVVIVAMTVLTAPVGARLAHRMNAAPLKRVFAGFLFLVALNMLRKTLG
ncbi:sulfite exporter TauE/SafE family protein [Jannaschia sp. S6380]|uniref:sulfite exporter TauE/SafE family protein n=1 Tax=Jannaschia sp. S6380 TaxID=2926408 RepID=UPI001FF20AC5|nr:sulfite exporter TauE/SafE family protein [Jannaschia sp. S6380]MCK0166622.1 sulfite exporter TauE/SafE family protein [Jannaschia sp. S6380]